MKKKSNYDFKFYYLRDQQKSPRVTVCIATDGENVSRGISICSPTDRPCKKTGRRVAMSRAAQSLNSKTNHTIVNSIFRETQSGPVQTAFSVANDYPTHDKHQNAVFILNIATFNPELTNFEKKLFG